MQNIDFDKVPENERHSSFQTNSMIDQYNTDGETLINEVVNQNEMTSAIYKEIC